MRLEFYVVHYAMYTKQKNPTASNFAVTAVIYYVMFKIQKNVTASNFAATAVILR